MLGRRNLSPTKSPGVGLKRFGSTPRGAGPPSVGKPSPTLTHSRNLHMHELPLIRPLMEPCAVSLCLPFAAAACSSDSTGPVVTNTVSPAAPAAPSAGAGPEGMADEVVDRGNPTPTSNGSTEAPPMNVD